MNSSTWFCLLAGICSFLRAFHLISDKDMMIFLGAFSFTSFTLDCWIERRKKQKLIETYRTTINKYLSRNSYEKKD